MNTDERGFRGDAGDACKLGGDLSQAERFLEEVAAFRASIACVGGSEGAPVELEVDVLLLAHAVTVAGPGSTAVQALSLIELILGSIHTVRLH